MLLLPQAITSRRYGRWREDAALQGDTDAVETAKPPVPPHPEFELKRL